MVNCSGNLSAIIENYVPSMEELKTVVENSLKENFAEASVDIIDCPDISQPPLNFKSNGFGKNMRIAEVGGPGNLFPVLEKEKEFNLRDIVATCELPNGSCFGPGAGPWPILQTNCEMVADANFQKDRCSTRCARIYQHKDYRAVVVHSARFNLMANLAVFESDETAPVIHFKVRQRKGSTNLPETIRRALAAKYGDKVVSLAGLFIMQEGEAKAHVMPDFPECPWENSAEIDKWLKYFNMKAPLVCTTVFHSYDPGHKLRMEHTHFFSDHGDSGHYHYDVTPETVVYEGWLAPSHKIYRIDEI